MFKRALSFVVILCCMASFSSCTDQASCEELLLRMLAVSGEDTEGNGRIFLASACEGELEYFSKEIRAIMYGAEERNFARIEDFAIFVSQRSAGELAVFKCYSASDTDLVANMCLERADGLKVALRGSCYEKKSEGIKVSVYGHTVVFYFVENVKKAEDKLKKAV